MCFTATKVTSPGSQFSVSDAPTVPNPTPFSESAFTDFHPPFDHVALASQLADNQDQLNEAANEAMYPSPPINTPEALSPAPSIIHRVQARGRGISFGLGDRLAQVKLEERRFHCGSDNTSCNHSVDHSLVEEDEEYDCASEMMGNCDKTVDPGHGSMSLTPLLTSHVREGLVPIALGSPTVNPRLQEYLSFSTASVSDAPTAAHADHVLTSSTTLVDSDSVKLGNSPNMNKALGVAERTNWAEEVEEYVDGAFRRLEQLAVDEHATNPSKSVDEYYIARLKRMLSSSKRPIPVIIPDPVSVENETKKEAEFNKVDLEDPHY